MKYILIMGSALVLTCSSAKEKIYEGPLKNGKYQIVGYGKSIASGIQYQTECREAALLDAQRKYLMLITKQTGKKQEGYVKAVPVQKEYFYSDGTCAVVSRVTTPKK